MDLLNVRIGEIKTLRLPKGHHKLELQKENGRVTGADLPTVAAVEQFIDKAKDIFEGHTDSDGPETWYEPWSQKMDRNNRGRDLDESSTRSLRIRKLSPTNSLVAEAIDGAPLVPEFPQLSEREPASFSVRDSEGFVSIDYRWKDGELQSLKEVRAFPDKPREEMTLTIDDAGRILLETSVVELSIP